MPFAVTVAIKASDIDAIAKKVQLITGISYEPHESSYLGEYNLFKIPEPLMVKYNYVAAESEWDEPSHIEFPVLLVAGATERPSYIKDIATKLGCEFSVAKEQSWPAT